MKITEEDKQVVIDALASNPKATTHPIPYSELLHKSGFKSGKLNAVKETLLQESRIWQGSDGSGRRVIYLVIADKRQQILDLIKSQYSEDRFYYGSNTGTLAEFCKISKRQAQDIVLRLDQEGLVEITSMRVEPSQQDKDTLTISR